MTGPRDVLNQLDTAHEAWSTDDGRRVATTNGQVWNELFRAPRWMDDDEVHALVHLHNEMPVLTAALRNVLDLADEYSDLAICNQAAAHRLYAEGMPASAAAPEEAARIYNAAADRITAALTHLAGDHTTPETRADAVDEIERRERQAAAKALNEAAAWVWDQPKPWAEVWHELRDRAIALDPELP